MKNFTGIYSSIYCLHSLCVHVRPIVVENGLWDQVRVDCGREFALLLFVQQLLSSHRTNTNRLPYLQTRSTEVWQLGTSYYYYFLGYTHSESSSRKTLGRGKQSSEFSNQKGPSNHAAGRNNRYGLWTNQILRVFDGGQNVPSWYKTPHSSME